MKYSLFSSKFLPEDHGYWPSITIQHIDCRSPKRTVIIGAVMLRHPEKYFVANETSSEPISDIRRETVVRVNFDDDAENDDQDESKPLISNKAKKKRISFLEKLMHLPTDIFTRQDSGDAPFLNDTEVHYSWWTKFYNSFERELNSDNIVTTKKQKLKIYNTELEKMPEFSFFEDWAAALPLSAEKKLEKNKIPFENSYCVARCSITINKCMENETSESPASVNRDSINRQWVILLTKI
jgi:hypothetical protein